MTDVPEKSRLSYAMRLAIEQEQRTTVSHRMNFVGRPSAPDNVSWDYEGRPWLVKRPDDGSPAVQRSVQCPVCSKTLTYTVNSVAETRRRRARRWVWALSGFAVFVIAPLNLLIVGAGPVQVTIAVSAASLGFFTGYLSAYVAVRETGFIGHGASWPVVPKHMVALPQYDPKGLP